MIGRTIDRYRVIEQLGQGGMGVVYKARDTVLDRFVALKVLPADKSSDPERRRRFLHEAKSLSALNHPGIVAVHDLLAVDERDVLVMEMVDGETLETFIARRRLPLGEALGLAIEIADALAQAHASGIVHRDLKPANVMVTADGVKVLDFGLAKLIESTYVDPESPTIAPDESSMTRERAIVGTYPWMSPEQAAGEPVDARSDIFSFGILLYELLTGRHPFRRATPVETLAAIRNEKPEAPTEIVPSLPPEAERAALRCLHKNPNRRWQSLSDLGAVLADLKEDTESGRKVLGEPGPTRRRVHPAFIAALVAIAITSAVALALFQLTRNQRHTTPPLDLRRLTYDTGASFSPAISPDGNFVAFASDRGGAGNQDIWVRHINQPEPLRLTDHPAGDWLPRFSPDGSRIVFRSERDGGGLFIVNALGGEARRIAGSGLFPQFSPDGANIAYSDSPNWAPSGLLRLYRVDVDGGTPEPLVPGYGVWRPPRGTGPIFSPDGTMIMFHGAPLDDPARSDWWVAPFPDGEPRSSGALEAFPRIDIVQFPAVWLPGRLLILAGTTMEGINLYSARISDTGSVSGPIEALTTGPGMTWSPSVAENGRIALARFHWVMNLWEVPLDATTGRATAPPLKITSDAAPKFSLSLSSNGDVLAYSAYAGPRGDRRGEIRLQDRVNGTDRVALSLPAKSVSLDPHLSPDGVHFSWGNYSEGKWVTFVSRIDTPGGRQLCTGCNVIDFFSSGEEILVSSKTALSRIRIDTGEEDKILALDEVAFLGADLSSDDRWLAMRVGEPDGRVTISAVPLGFPATNRESWIEIVGGEFWIGPARWSADGRLLYYLSKRDDFICVWAMPLDPETKVPTGPPFAVAHAHSSSMQMSAPQAEAWTLAVAPDRLVFNAAEMKGEIYTAMLEP